ncbi:MAG: RICIN domain-containing protein [Clostridia bacterium]|nr:RICIN domain-containing protein [Clostridia bacterium]
MKQTKRILSVLLAVMMLLAVVPVGNVGITASAYNVSSAVSYADGHWNDGVGLCAEFVAKCLNAGGVSIPNSASYYSNSKQSYQNNSGTLGAYTNPYTCSAAQLLWFSDQGYQIITNPSDSEFSLGDVAFMPNSNGSKDGHVGIITQISNGAPYYSAHNYARHNARLYNCTYLVKMNGSSIPSDYINLGDDFWAYIIKSDSWKHLESTGSNVQLAANGNDSNNPKQIWEFIRQTDGSYIIKNAYNDRCIDAAGWGTSNGTNVGVVGANGTSAQKWYILQNGSGFYIRTAYCDLVMDVTSDSNEPGANIELWTKNTSSAQKFNIYGLAQDGINYSKPGRPAGPTLSIKTLGTAETATVLQWTSSPLKSSRFDKRCYDIRIWQGTSTDGASYKSQYGMTGTTYEVNLPAGTYIAKAYAINSKYYEWWNDGAAITFTVKNCTHSWNSGTVTTAATCTTDGVRTYTCTVCGGTKTETITKLGHSYGAWTKLNDTQHQRVCSRDSSHVEKANHTWNSGAVTKAATCCTTGTKTYTCSVCNGTKTETIAINSSNHVNTTNVAATASTCTVKGYSAGVYCNDCKKYISGHQEQPLNAHTITVINKRDATYDAEGYTGDDYCTVCKQTIHTGTAIPKLTRPTDPTPTDPTPSNPQPSGGCKWCGGNHGGAFGWLTKIFHNLFAAIFGARY